MLYEWMNEYMCFTQIRVYVCACVFGEHEKHERMCDN